MLESLKSERAGGWNAHDHDDRRAVADFRNSCHPKPRDQPRPLHAAYIARHLSRVDDALADLTRVRLVRRVAGEYVDALAGRAIRSRAMGRMYALGSDSACFYFYRRGRDATLVCAKAAGRCLPR